MFWMRWLNFSKLNAVNIHWNISLVNIWITEKNLIWLSWRKTCNHVRQRISHPSFIKGVNLIAPSQKNPIFKTHVVANFDIVATSIHIVWFIGQVREWSILNNFKSVTKFDLLTLTRGSLSCIFKLLFPKLV